jgi:hypothetical protein
MFTNPERIYTRLNITSEKTGPEKPLKMNIVHFDKAINQDARILMSRLIKMSKGNLHEGNLRPPHHGPKQIERNAAHFVPDKERKMTFRNLGLPKWVSFRQSD